MDILFKSIKGRKEGKNWKIVYRLWSYCFALEYNRTEDKDHCKSVKECEYLIGKTFPSPPRVMQGDNNAHHQNRKSQISLNHKLFISQFEYWLKHDLPIASNHINVV